jgi:hypothetical protein
MGRGAGGFGLRSIAHAQLQARGSSVEATGAYFGELDLSYLLPGINDERIWDRHIHLVFDESTIGERLDHVVAVDSFTGGGLECMNSTGTLPSAVRIRQSGLSEMLRALERNGLARKGWPERSW